METSNTQKPSHSHSSHEVTELIERDPRLHERTGPFEFWYHLTAPPKQSLAAPLALRETARLGRLTSTVLAFVAGSLIILAVPTSFAIHNPTLLLVLCVLLVIVSIALILNRNGKGIWGRVMVVCAMNCALAISVIIWPGGLTTNTLPIFDIMVVEPTLVALALLPPASVFIVAFCNVAFIGLDFYLQSHSVDLIKVMQFDGYEVVTRPLYLLIFVIGVVYPVMRSSLRALALGDRAKEIAKVQHDLAQREALIVQEKQLLDEGIEQLVHTLSQTANGNTQVRFTLPTAPSLWPIAGALNTLQTRTRSARQSEYEMQHTKDAATQLIAAIQKSKKNRQPLQIDRSGNPIIDAIIMELLSY